MNHPSPTTTMTSPTSLPTAMRAWQWTSIPTSISTAIRLSTTPVPMPQPGQLLLHVHYASLNPVDYKMPEMPFAGRLLALLRGPMTPGLDYAGTVVATGPGCAELTPRQLVFGALSPPGYGTLAEYILVPADRCAVVPEGVSALEAATVGIAGTTAWQCITPRLPQKDKGSGSKVFINGGSGGTGTFGIQFAKAHGCYVVTTCSARNVELCRRLGADEVLDYTKGGVVQALSAHAREHGPFDLVVDNIGGASELYWQCQEYLKDGAPYVSVGASPRLGWAAVDLAKIFLWPRWLGGGKRRYEFLTAKGNSGDYEEIGRLMREGRVRAEIEEVYGMEDVPRAFERLKSGRVSGKLVVKVS